MPILTTFLALRMRNKDHVQGNRDSCYSISILYRSALAPLFVILSFLCSVLRKVRGVKKRVGKESEMHTLLTMLKMLVPALKMMHKMVTTDQHVCIEQ